MPANLHVHHTCHTALKNVNQRRRSTTTGCPVTIKDMQKISHTQYGIPEQKPRNTRAKLQAKYASGSMTALNSVFMRKTALKNAWAAFF